jgi:hypothetical protein
LSRGVAVAGAALSGIEDVARDGVARRGVFTEFALLS